MTDILDLIDGAIADWETSGDAMRWTPDPPAAPPGTLTPLQSAEAVVRAGDHMIVRLYSESAFEAALEARSPGRSRRVATDLVAEDRVLRVTSQAVPEVCP